MAVRSMSIVALRRELARRESQLKTLQAKRTKVARQLASIDAEIARLGGGRGPGRPAGSRGGKKTTSRRGRKPGPKKGSRKRARNKLTLPDALVAAVRKGSTVSPAQAAKAVRAKGYKSTSKTFGQQVAQTLAKDKRFRKVGRGQYQLVVRSAPAKTRKPRKPTKTTAKRKSKKVRRRRKTSKAKVSSSSSARASTAG